MPLQAFWSTDPLWEAGCDEAGRGCMAGPVFAAAVVLPPEARTRPEAFFHPQLNDSKQLTAARREDLRTYVETHAWAWAVAWWGEGRIDRYNILRASISAMQEAVTALGKAPAGGDWAQALASLPPDGCVRGGAQVRPELLLIDGNRFYPYTAPDGTRVPHQCVVKGDGKLTAIAAASILAKTYRDQYMDALALRYPVYGWDRNKGYLSAEHRKALAQYGPSPRHRQSFHIHEKEPELF